MTCTDQLVHASSRWILCFVQSEIGVVWSQMKSLAESNVCICNCVSVYHSASVSPLIDPKQSRSVSVLVTYSLTWTVILSVCNLSVCVCACAFVCVSLLSDAAMTIKKWKM